MTESSSASPRSRGRGDFLKIGGAATAALLTPSAFAVAPNKTLPSLPSNPRTPDAMPTRNLGKTGYKVGIFSLGGQAALEKPNNFDIAVPIIDRALDLGVNYIDTSSIYGGPDRWSEQFVGKVMAKRRNEAFLATKTKERTRDGSMRMIEKSLELLQTDHVDLWQLHDVGTIYDVNQIFAKGGAMEALLDMQQQKVVRYLGITGHYRPDALIECIHRHRLRLHSDGNECGRPASLQLQRGVAAAGGRKADGNYRDEDSGPRTYSFHLDTAADRAAEALLGRHDDPDGQAGHADHARSDVLHAFAAGQHGNYWMRYDHAARRECATGAQFHAD